MPDERQRMATLTAGIFGHVPATEAGKRPGLLNRTHAAHARLEQGNGHGGDSGGAQEAAGVSWQRTPEGHANGPYRITRKGGKWWARWHSQETHAKHPVYLGMHASVANAKAACEKHRDTAKPQD